MGADANLALEGASMMHVSTLERLSCCIRADQTGNHDSRGNAQTLVREVNQLDWLLAPQLLDLERMTVNTASRDMGASEGIIQRMGAPEGADGVNGSRLGPGVQVARF